MLFVYVYVSVIFGVRIVLNAICYIVSVCLIHVICIYLRVPMSNGISILDDVRVA